MASESAPNDLIRHVVAALDAAGVPYMLTGSFASSLHGIPRSTQDVDFVISPDDRSIEGLIGHFPSNRYYLSRAAAINAVRQESLFNVIDLETGWKIDFIVRKGREFSRAEFERRTRIELLGVGVFVATPEDVLISKMEWAKRSGSERQIEDAAGIVRTQGRQLDFGYVERWVRGLELQPQWGAALERSK